MRWFSSKAKNVSSRPSRCKRGLRGFEQMEDRVCLTATAVVADADTSSECGVEDSVGAFPIDVLLSDGTIDRTEWDFKEVLSTDDSTRIESGGIEGSDIGSGGSTSDPELDAKLVTGVEDEPLESGGIEGSDIGSGGATSDPDFDGIDTKIVSTRDDSPVESGGIEGSDIGSGGATSDPELDTKLVTSIDGKPLETDGIEGSDIGSGGSTSDPEVDEFDTKVRR